MILKLPGVRAPAETDVTPLTNGPYEVFDIDCIHTPGCEESEGAPRETLTTTTRPLEYSLWTGFKKRLLTGSALLPR